MAQRYFTDQRKYTIDWDPINFVPQPGSINTNDLKRLDPSDPTRTRKIRVHLKSGVSSYHDFETKIGKYSDEGCVVSLTVSYTYPTDISDPNVQYNTAGSGTLIAPRPYKNFYYPVGFTYTLTSMPPKIPDSRKRAKLSNPRDLLTTRKLQAGSNKRARDDPNAEGVAALQRKCSASDSVTTIYKRDINHWEILA